MFNGIIKNTGIIRKIIKQNKSLTILVYSNIKVGKKMIGSSISCDGVCLTLTNTKNRTLKFYLSKETLNRSNFSKIKVGTIVNMEKSLKFGDEISGHYTQGHVDTVGKVIKLVILDKTWIVRVAVPSKFNKLIVEKYQSGCHYSI